MLIFGLLGDKDFTTHLVGIQSDSYGAAIASSRDQAGPVNLVPSKAN